MTTAVILLTCSVAVLVILFVWESSQHRTALYKVLRMMNSTNLMYDRMLNKTLDRLMARDYQEFRAYHDVEAMEGYVEESGAPLSPEGASQRASTEEPSPAPSSPPPLDEEGHTVEFQTEELPPRYAPLVHGERWVPPEMRGIDSEEVPRDHEDR